MSTLPPDIIHVNWNAADGYARFRKAGIEATADHPPTPEQIIAVLGLQRGLFRLQGWVDDPPADVILKVEGGSGAVVELSNQVEPPFTGVYTIAEQPPPQVTQHGDYQFDLELASTTI